MKSHKIDRSKQKITFLFIVVAIFGIVLFICGANANATDDLANNLDTSNVDSCQVENETDEIDFRAVDNYCKDEAAEISLEITDLPEADYISEDAEMEDGIIADLISQVIEPLGYQPKDDDPKLKESNADDYLKFYSENPFKLNLDNLDCNSTNGNGTIKVCTDSTSWVTYSTPVDAVFTDGKYFVYLKVINSYSAKSKDKTSGGISFNTSSGASDPGDLEIYCEGPISALVNAGTSSTEFFLRLFQDCKSLVSPPDMSSITKLEARGVPDCGYMFSGCTSLNQAPDLSHVTSIGGSAASCEYMFYGCKSLKVPPSFSSLKNISTGGIGQCAHMFDGCENLLYAPDFPSLESVTGGGGNFEYMFKDCGKIVWPPSFPSLKTFLGPNMGKYMFANCTSLLRPPDVTTTLTGGYGPDGLMSNMCDGCTSLKISDEPTDELKKEWIIRDLKESCSDPAPNMFNNCAGPFTGTPEKGKTYYVMYKDEELFDLYKDEQKDVVDGLLQEGDSSAIQDIIADAKDLIDTTDFDEELSLDENKAVIDAIVAAAKVNVVNQRAADNVSELISNLPEPVTIDDEAQIFEAKAAYDALTSEQKALVDPALVSSLNAKVDAVNTLKVNYVSDLIENLPADVSIEDEPQIMFAYDAYNALTDNQKALVDPSLVESLMEKVSIVSMLKVEQVKGLIENLPNPKEITLADEAVIVAARDAYNRLTNEQAEIFNVTYPTLLQKLIDCETAISKAKEKAQDQLIPASNDSNDSIIQTGDLLFYSIMIFSFIFVACVFLLSYSWKKHLNW